MELQLSKQEQLILLWLRITGQTVSGGRKFAIRAFDLARVEAERRAPDAGAASFGGVGEGD